MTLLLLLEFTDTRLPPYFEPATDLELSDEEDDERNSLSKAHYSRSTLVDALNQGKMDKSNV